MQATQICNCTSLVAVVGILRSCWQRGMAIPQCGSVNFETWFNQVNVKRFQNNFRGISDIVLGSSLRNMSTIERPQNFWAAALLARPWVRPWPLLLHSDIIHGHATQEMPSLKGPPPPSSNIMQLFLCAGAGFGNWVQYRAFTVPRFYRLTGSHMWWSQFSEMVVLIMRTMSWVPIAIWPHNEALSEAIW